MKYIEGVLSIHRDLIVQEYCYPTIRDIAFSLIRVIKSNYHLLFLLLL